METRPRSRHGRWLGDARLVAGLWFGLHVGQHQGTQGLQTRFTPHRTHRRKRCSAPRRRDLLLLYLPGAASSPHAVTQPFISLAVKQLLLSRFYGSKSLIKLRFAVPKTQARPLRVAWGQRTAPSKPAVAGGLVEREQRRSRCSESVPASKKPPGDAEP